MATNVLNAKRRDITQDCPHRKKAEHGDKKDPEGKKPFPMLDVINEKPSGEEAELMWAWGVCDQAALFFFDSGSKANFISPNLGS